MTQVIHSGLPSHPSHVSICTSAPAIEYHTDSHALLLMQPPELHCDSCIETIC